MLYLKKYLTEGLIQFTILLSLIGVRVDVDTYLSSQLPPLREIILGPSSAYTQTQFHNLRNTLDGYGLHPKSVDLDYYFTARRLLGEVRSLDRLQVPSTELSAWLVHRDAEVSSPQSGSSSGIALENASGGLEEVGNPEGSAMRGNGSLDQGYVQESEENLGAMAPEDSNELHNDSRSNNLTKEGFSYCPNPQTSHQTALRKPDLHLWHQPGFLLPLTPAEQATELEFSAAFLGQYILNY